MVVVSIHINQACLRLPCESQLDQLLDQLCASQLDRTITGERGWAANG